MNHGLYIQAITVGSGADQSDLEAGDIIVGINDESVGRQSASWVAFWQSTDQAVP